MMFYTISLLLLALSAAIAAPSPFDDYPEVREKRAALVLDRLLVALNNLMHEDQRERVDREGPRASPLRISNIDDVSMIPVARSEESWLPKERRFEAQPAALRLATIGEETSALQRRGQGGGGRGRVLRCYFNAVTCF